MKKSLLLLAIVFTLATPSMAFFSQNISIPNTTKSVQNAYHQLTNLKIDNKNKIVFLTFDCYETKESVKETKPFTSYNIKITKNDGQWETLGKPFLVSIQPNVKALVKALLAVSDQDFE